MDRREKFRAERTLGITESVIREMSRLSIQHGAVNLAQGYPDFAAPEILKEAARQAITEDVNQYAITWGSKPFRDAIAERYRDQYGLEFDPEHAVKIEGNSSKTERAAYRDESPFNLNRLESIAYWPPPREQVS